jgi:hypothetical protein
MAGGEREVFTKYRAPDAVWKVWWPDRKRG